MATTPQFLIAAPTSGSGKTTISRGLMALFTKKRLKVQPFKCGPDYIDTKYHTAVCGRSSINLDAFMASHDHVRQLYAYYALDADVCMVEGMMGMYDGYDRDKGSSAEIAMLLHLPVVLVVNAQSVAYSIAPLLSGFIHFRPNIHIAGVIFNCVGSPRHYEMLREVCEDLEITCLGYLPKESVLEQDSRYLGLDFSKQETTEATASLIDLIDRYIDWELLLQITSLPLSTGISRKSGKVPWVPLSEKINITVARNEESFSFLYAEHLDILHHMGTVTYYNPEKNHPLPAETDFLYLPGGYPEKHVEKLSQATQTLVSICDYIEAGGRVLAECGGMMYLSQGICFDTLQQAGNVYYPMTRVFPFSISNQKQHRKLSLGYRQFDYNGLNLRGHEFHYTQFIRGEEQSVPDSIVQVYNARKQPVDTPVFRYKNVIASYTHLYWGEINLMELFK